MKTDRFNNLHITETEVHPLRTEYRVASDTDRWSVTLIDNKWGVTHQGRTYRPVTSTPQGKIILNFVYKVTSKADAWNHNAPYNSEFLGAQPARAGQDY